MLFHVQMTVRLPHDMPATQADELKMREKALAQELQRTAFGVTCGASPAATPM